jgi:hypothetical protein
LPSSTSLDEQSKRQTKQLEKEIPGIKKTIADLDNQEKAIREQMLVPSRNLTGINQPHPL